jgi:hypothetical protein
MEKGEPRKTCVYVAEPICNASHGIGGAERAESHWQNESQISEISGTLSATLAVILLKIGK